MSLPIQETAPATAAPASGARSHGAAPVGTATQRACVAADIAFAFAFGVMLKECRTTSVSPAFCSALSLPAQP
jgi:hypothetical protein